jgi:hypothetical protein
MEDPEPNEIFKQTLGELVAQKQERFKFFEK